MRAFVTARRAGTQDLWHTRLYLLKPLIRLTLATLWLASAALGLRSCHQLIFDMRLRGYHLPWR